MGQNTLDTDTFGGTAATALHSYDANWINSTLNNLWNDCVISTPNGSATGGGIQNGSYRIGQTWTNDQFAQMTIAALSLTHMALYVRLTGDGGNNPATGYKVGPNPNSAGNNSYRLYKVDGTLLAASATIAAVSDVVNLEIVGTTITVRVNGSILSDLTTTDATHASGNPGLYIDDVVGKFSTWSAGSVTSGSAGGPLVNNGRLVHGSLIRGGRLTA